jgi:hypothetical protein
MASKTLHLRTVASLGLVVALSAGVGAQTKGKPAISSPTPIRVDGKIIKGYIAYMADDAREGRQSLTPGYEKTAEWAAAKFKEWGLKPAGDNGTFLQNVPITGQYSGFAWTTGIPELTVDGRRFYVKDDDFRLSNTSTPGTEAAGEIVFVGYGIAAPAKGLDEYAGLDVKGRIVIAFKGTPKSAPAARGMFGVTAPEPKDVEAWADESKDVAKIRTAYDKGAAAIILFSPEKLAPAAPAQPGVMPAMVTGGPSQPAEPPVFARPFLVVTDINERAFRQVMYRDPQESSRGFVSRIDQVRRDIRDKKARSQATGVKAQIKGYATTTFYGEKYKNNISHNVIGKIEGTDPKLKDQYIVIGGHMDHVGVTNGVVYNGADDDASGTAVTMEMARLVAANATTIKPKRTIIFALWCAEEMGLIGSNYWTKTPSDGVKMENVVVNFNCDMVGLGERIGAPGALNFPAIYDVIMRNQDPDVAKVVDPSTAGPGGSDYSGFIEQGIEALALMTSGGVGHPDYHDAGDDIEKIDPEILRKTGQFVLQGVINVANDATTTMIVPDRLHLYNGMRMPLLNLATAGGGGGGIVIINGVVQQAGPSGPRFSTALSDVGALGGNLALIDVAAKVMNIGRIDVRPESNWFATTGLTDRGKAALKAFEAASVSLNFINPPKALLDSVLDNVKRGFIVSNLTLALDPDLAKRMTEKNGLLAVVCDLSAPAALAAKLIDLKKLFGGSGNLLLVSYDTTMPTDPIARRKVEDAKQQLYLPLVKAGWTKEEIAAMVGVNPPLTMEQMMAGVRAQSGLPGNLNKLSK